MANAHVPESRNTLFVWVLVGMYVTGAVSHHDNNSSGSLETLRLASNDAISRRDQMYRQGQSVPYAQVYICINKKEKKS